MATGKLQTISNFIDGKASQAADGRTSELIDPTNGEAYATAPLSGSRFRSCSGNATCAR